MKKQIIVILFLILSLSAFTQVVTVKAGPTFSKIKWDNSVMYFNDYFEQSYVGFYASVGLDYLQKKGFCLNSNIGYFTNGGKGKISLTDEYGNLIGDTTQTTKLNFFTLNTIAKYTFLTEKKVSPFVGAGIGFNYLVSYDESFNFLEEFDKESELNIILWGVIGTAGLNVKLNNLKLGAEVLYNYNLNKLVNYEGVPGWSNKITVNYFSVLFSVGYKLK